MDVESDGQRVHLTHLNKIYFPEVGLKKRDLLAYYYRMAEYILPFLKDRPMVLRRYPDGVGGKAFFQKEAPSFLPDWIGTATVESEERGGEMQYILCEHAGGAVVSNESGMRRSQSVVEPRGESGPARLCFLRFGSDAGNSLFGRHAHCAGNSRHAEVDSHAVFFEDVGSVGISYFRST